jgi:hypothetical protein
MKNQIRNLVDAKVQEAGGNKRVGWENAGNELVELIESGKLRSSDFSIRQLYEELVDCPINEDAGRVAEAVNSSAFPIVAKKIIHSDIIDEYNLALGAVGSLVRESQATRTDDELVAGFNAGDTTPLLRRQGMAYEETAFGEKNWKIIMADFGRMISLTREVIYEDRTGEVLGRARDIGRAGGQHKAKMIVQTIEAAAREAFEENAFGGAVYKGDTMAVGDVYSADHSAFDGQVNENLVTLNGLEDWTDIDKVYLAFGDMVDEAGNKINIVPSAILIPPALKATAFKIMNSQWLQSTSGGGGTQTTDLPTYNPINDITGGQMNVVSSVFMSDSTTWFCGDFPSQLLGLNVYAPATASQGADAELAFTNQIVARFRFSYHYGIGLTDWRHIIKSTA